MEFSYLLPVRLALLLQLVELIRTHRQLKTKLLDLRVETPVRRAAIAFQLKHALLRFLQRFHHTLKKNPIIVKLQSGK